MAAPAWWGSRLEYPAAPAVLVRAGLLRTGLRGRKDRPGRDAPGRLLCGCASGEKVP
ncbi:MAG: hypothetical protein NT125_07095 [Candidatus Bipolaricaulota bacterium]|nr:hypothetical protein [Candidatus Bipolaricaulota bacterium]